MKVSIKKNQVIIGAVVLVVVLIGLAVGKAAREDEPGKLDNAAVQACDDFADGYDKARTKTTRLALADKVAQSSAGSDNDAIVDHANAMGRSANDSTAVWRSDAKSFTQACRDAGWAANRS